MLTEILIFSLLSFAAIAAINAIGKFLTPFFVKFQNEGAYHSFFLECVIGLTTIVTGYSCVCTGFLTVNLGFIILFIILFITNKNYKNYLPDMRMRFCNGSISLWIYVFFLCLIVTFLNVIYPLPESIGNDVLFYVKVAKDIGRSGRENIFCEYNKVVPEFNGTSPYHYFELWVGSVLFKILGNYFTDIIIMKYVGYVILKTFAICGFLALIENFKKIIIWDIMIIVFLSTFNFLYLTEIGGNAWTLYHDMWLRPNIAVYFIFLTLLFNSLYLKKYQNAIAFSLFLPIVSTVTAPAIFTGILMLILYLFLCKEISKMDAIFFAFVVFVIALFVVLFYTLTAVDSKVLSTDNRTLFQMLAYSISIYKAIIYFLISLSLRATLLLTFSCILLFIFLKNWKPIITRNSTVLFSALIISLSGIIFFQIFAFVDNTYQFPYVGYASCYIVGFVLLYQMFFNSLQYARNKTVFFIFAGIFFSFNCIYIGKNFNCDFVSKTITELEFKRAGIDNGFVQNISNYFSSTPECNGGFIMGEKDILNMEGTRQSLTFQLGNYLAYLRSDLCLVSLTSPDVLYCCGFDKSKFYQKAFGFNKLTPFYRNYFSGNYIEELSKYVEQNRIHFLVVSRNFQMDQLQSFKVKEIIADNNTGTKFIVLN